MHITRLLNGDNVTMNDENMWLIPFDEEATQYMKVNFPHPTTVTGIRIWNYNKSLEDTCRGVCIYLILAILDLSFWKCIFGIA